MCGRFTQTKGREEVLDELGGIGLPPRSLGRYNIAPGQMVATIPQHAPTMVAECLWGFAGRAAGATVINARSETLSGRPMFRNLAAANRCLIPADGFYEWKGRQPYYFQLPDRRIFALAGLWHGGRCVVLTRAADAGMQGIHPRMPVILRQPDWDGWMRGACWTDRLADRLPEPPPLAVRPVSTRVNAVAHDDPACLAPGEVQSDLSLFPENR